MVGCKVHLYIIRFRLCLSDLYLVNITVDYNFLVLSEILILNVQLIELIAMLIIHIGQNIIKKHIIK